MDFLIGLLLTPFFPQLKDPQDVYGERVNEVVQLLAEDASRQQALALQDPAQQVVQAPEPESVAPPDPIAGRLLKDWMGSRVLPHEEVASASEQRQPLMLTGVLQIGGDRVAILNDGLQDYVVGAGSFVQDSLQVAQVRKDSVQLRNLASKKNGELFDIHLQATATNGDGR